MAHAQLIRDKLAAVLASVGYECERDEARMTIMKWGVGIEVVEGEEKASTNGVTIFTAIYATHGLLPGGAVQELSVGIGSTLQQAVEDVSTNWMLLFFPTLKFLFDEQPHDCTVHELDLPTLGDDAYRLIGGPVQMRGFGAQHTEDMSQTLLWNTVADLVPARIKHGVHHLRCFSGRFGDEFSADVFLDGVQWEEASERLTELAATFPKPSDEEPIYSLKQHLILRPADLRASSQRDENSQLSHWLAALMGKVPAQHQDLTMPVLRTLYVMSKGGPDQQVEDALVSRGMDRTLAARMVTFLQSAAARVVIGERIRFSDTYYWANGRTRRAILRRYDETAEFTAGVTILGLLWQAETGQREIFAVASRSAEMKIFSQVSEAKTDLKDARITSMIHHTDEAVEGANAEDLDAIMASFDQKPKPPAFPPSESPRASRHVAPTPRRAAPTPKKPWWKFW